MKHYNNNSGYSIVISLLMVGFLIVVTSWVFNLVLGELNDNRGRENYLKAFAAAEWSLEIALLQIKEKGYGYYGTGATSSGNIILVQDPANIKPARDPIISYDLDSKTNTYSDTLNSLWYAIVPLFIITDPVWIWSDLENLLRRWLATFPRHTHYNRADRQSLRSAECAH